MKPVIIIAIAFVLLIPINVYADSDFRYDWKETWEKLGEHGITMLKGIVIDSKDNVYVIDSNRLVKLTTDNQREWTVIFEIHPTGELFLNQNDEIILTVSHKEVYELKKYSQSGELVKTWNLNNFENSFENSFAYVDKQENIYLTQWDTIREDSTNIIGVVKKFDSDGNLLKTFENMGLLQQIDDKGNLYTTEKGKVVKYDYAGNKIAEYGKQEFRGGVGTFSQHATSVIVDSNGLIFATGGDYGPINIIDEDGNFAGIGGYGMGDGRYGSPRGIALDSENNAYVTDYSRNKILVYERISLQKTIQSEPEPEPTPEPESKELGIASFVDKSKDPQSYIDRYNSEPGYKKWFHENYPQYDSIQQAVGLELTQKIPDWVKNIFLWYGQDQVSEDELLNAIKYLIKKGILVVN